VKFILLTQGLSTTVDDEDFEELKQDSWCAHKDVFGNYYARRRQGKKHIYMHHQIMGKPPKGLELDHRDGNRLNNLRSNLRFVTHRQNCQNRMNEEKSSQYPGVSWITKRQKWDARTQINGKIKWLGYFDNEEDAAKAYQDIVTRLEIEDENIPIPELTSNLLASIKESRDENGETWLELKVKLLK